MPWGTPPSWGWGWVACVKECVCLWTCIGTFANVVWVGRGGWGGHPEEPMRLGVCVSVVVLMWSSAASADPPPSPDGYGLGPVTLVEDWSYLPGGPQGLWAYCQRHVRGVDECQWISHPPFYSDVV